MNKRMMILGAAVAGIVAASTANAAGDAAKKAAPAGDKVALGECHGINSCKGKSECGGGTGHECGGQNTCKGQGWVKMSKKDCDAKKGKWETLKMDM
jgi:uncharacterized membrane protein